MDRTVTLFCLNLPHGAAIELVDDPMKHLREAAGLQMPAFDKASPLPSANTPNGVVGIRFQFPERDLVSEVRYLEEELAKLNIERMQVEVELKESKERYHEQAIEHRNEIARLKEDAADREKQLTRNLNILEKKLIRNLNILQTEKSATQKELDEVKSQKSEGVDPLVIDPFGLGLGASAQQATWALEACIEDTDRRMDETGKIGTALVQKRSELSERLDEMAQLPPEEELSLDAIRALEADMEEVERHMEEAGKIGTALIQNRNQLSKRLGEMARLPPEEELTPELRKRFADAEKDYNEVTRQSARFFHTNQPISSIKVVQDLEYLPQERGRKGSASSWDFERLANASPTRPIVPNRKLAVNNRVEDIEFAAEISSSLLTQVRNLQGQLSEKDEELRELRAENSRLETQARAVQ
ncbi:hypothetical protein EKO27_g3341 [Xylaria grammica]|uniref:Uncharacterized protein n=1 Tax=Xylaria grammica TaxID=363999 RepID=A0A439DBH4_9PEZI|nr:hypothetical protein EKO27_g3341 [Xylaria grammica]